MLEQAARLAAERHSAVEALWAQERKEKDQEIAELVADLDQAAPDKDVASAAFAGEITRLEAQRGALERELSDRKAVGGVPGSRTDRR